jgi:hypothetical protein
MRLLLVLLFVLGSGPTEPTYVYQAKTLRVLDGDTYEFLIDLGFQTSTTQEIRLYHWDCPELPTPEGKAAAAKAESLLKDQTVLVELILGPRSHQTHPIVHSLGREGLDRWEGSRRTPRAGLCLCRSMITYTA